MTMWAASGYESLLQYAVTAITLFFSQTVYCLFGFGSGMLAISVLSFFYARLTPLVVLLLLINLPSEIIVLSRSHREVRLEKVRWILPGMFLGTVAGTRILHTGENSTLYTALGIAIILFSLFFLFNAQPMRTLKPPAAASVGVGAMSGFLAGLFSMGGPPVILFFRLTTGGKGEFRASLISIFFITGLIRIPLYCIQGLIGTHDVAAAVLAMPVVLAGTYVGNHLHLRIDERHFRKGVAVVLCTLGLLIVCYR